jgi:hypothetical protein
LLLSGAIPGGADQSIVVRYQDTGNYYLVHAYGTEMSIYEKLGGTYYQRVIGSLPLIEWDTWYRMEVRVEGGKLEVYWGGAKVAEWTDTTPWTGGRVGFRQCVGRHVQWDNFAAYTSVTPMVVSYDDMDAWGMVLGGRSGNAGDGRQRFKFTEKERDTETGYDYFGAR